MLWAVAVSTALHPIEEYFTGWQSWARESLGIAMTTEWFVAINVVLVLAAFVTASQGWRWQVLSLVIPAATLVNAIAFHIIPTIAEGRISPGVYTATALYVPFSTWAMVGAARDGVPRRHRAVGMILGVTMAVGVVVLARATTR